MINIPLKFRDPRPKCSQVIARNSFIVPGHYGLDHWPTDLKINRGHLLVMTILPINLYDLYTQV